MSLAEKETEAGGPATHADEAVSPEQATPAKGTTQVLANHEVALLQWEKACGGGGAGRGGGTITRDSATAVMK